MPVEIQLGKGTILWTVKVVNGIPTFDGKTDTGIYIYIYIYIYNKMICISVII